MSERIRITPRARRLARAHGIDPAVVSVQGTGFQGGVTEKDLLAWIESSSTFIEKESDIVHATSVARKIAAEHGMGLAGIPGTGSFGKIIKEDVLAAIAGGGLAGRHELEETEIPVVGVTADGKRIAKVVPYAGVRKIIGDRLSESMFTAPHLYFTQKADLTDLLKLRELVNSKQDKKTSVTDYIARAAVMALRTFPQMNASLTAGGIEEYASINLGIAVAAPGGLIVPVLKEAQYLSVVGISKASSELVDKARNGRLLPEEYSGGTFTISNLGMFGIENFTAILNPPEAGILAISAAKDEAVVICGPDGTKRIDIRPMMNITLSVDHRVIDGLLAAQFVTEVKRLLESPLELMIRDWA